MKRRRFIKKSGQALEVASPILSFSSIVTSKSKKRPPNVIYIICDQMRGDALKAAGRPVVFSICEWGLNSPLVMGRGYCSYVAHHAGYKTMLELRKRSTCQRQTNGKFHGIHKNS